MKVSMPRFDQAAVLVVGDVMLDRYWHGGTSRISPEAPVPVVKVEQIEDRPGGAANVALNIAALGAPATLIGVTGEDEAAASLRNSLQAVGVKTFFQTIKDQPTIVKLRVMSRHQQLLRMDFEEPFRTDCAALAASVEAQLDGIKVLILSDYGKGALQNHQALVQLARSKGIAVLADPKGKDFSIYRGASLITPNLHEFETIVGHCRDEAELVARGAALMAELDFDPARQLLGAQCSGALILAKLGLLDGVPACTDLTTKPWVQEAGVTVLNQPFFAKGNVATAGGCLSAQYLAAWLIARLAGPEAVREVIHYFAPVGEKQEFIDRALGHVLPTLPARLKAGPMLYCPIRRKKVT